MSLAMTVAAPEPLPWSARPGPVRFVAARRGAGLLGLGGMLAAAGGAVLLRHAGARAGDACVPEDAGATRLAFAGLADPAAEFSAVLARR